MTVSTDTSKTGRLITSVSILAKSAIPFIGIATPTSCSAGGAMVLATALPVAYANAYIWLPANAAATTIAAGWYYATFSTTGAGTLYLNTYTSGTPTIPTNPIACTTASAWVGDTGEEFGPTITIPANVMGANGAVRTTYTLSSTNNANSKTPRIRFSGNGGTSIVSLAMVSVGLAAGTLLISNRGVTGVQQTQITGVTFVNNVAGNTQTAVDTTIASTIVVSIQRVVATDNLVVESFLIELLSDGA